MSGRTAPETSTTEEASPLTAAERRLDELAASGAGQEELERLILARLHGAQPQHTQHGLPAPGPAAGRRGLPQAPGRALPLRSHPLDPHDLPALSQAQVAKELFIFGLGRLFSRYNDMGVQHCTDVDLNIVAGDALAQGRPGVSGREPRGPQAPALRALRHRAGGRPRLHDTQVEGGRGPARASRRGAAGRRLALLQKQREEHQRHPGRAEDPRGPLLPRARRARRLDLREFPGLQGQEAQLRQAAAAHRDACPSSPRAARAYSPAR